TSRCSTAVACGCFRLSVRLFLLRLKAWKKWLSPSGKKCGPTERLTSPPSAGFSILITSAPRSPRAMLPNGPAPYCSTAMTRSPDSGSMGFGGAPASARRRPADAVDEGPHVGGLLQAQHRLANLLGLPRRQAHGGVA